ncbi:uncharacterized protein LTR77_002393 [Saxophila tyrrhenica]|uniref:C2H2-type domain-containing protein n=1 Tax=Saxophila tyrrhenica TaxID=1690608 RepID=A0AAV9PL39_9PEZI|nr:hypothetical protein LTR77_002393 [Saxophila tyrrhenica]
MATTSRSSTPHTEPFPPLDAQPRTPTSLSSLPVKTTNGPENQNLLKPEKDRIAAGFSPKLDKRVLSPLPLTGAAAMAELKKRKQQQQGTTSPRETSPNPAVAAMQKLMGGGGGMSRPSDAPSPSKLSEPVQSAAEKMSVDNAMTESMQTSPISLSSFGTLESTGVAANMTATAHDHPASGPQFVAEPAQMTEPVSYTNGQKYLNVMNDEGPKAFSYPGPPPQDQGEGGPSRGMSLPGFGQGSPKSPASSNKRHKCPYCSTDFTRHHNLKSHLLTHSQEKPYVCQTCQARFRRLHDLKRHTKLHTGERPHTCDKCGRKFARGDALARHNKGPGGCAGRRSSFGGDDEFGEGEGMDGVEYDGEDGSSPDHGRRVSEPSRKRAHLETPHDPNRQVYRQQSSTYPPPPQQQSRPHAGSMGNMGPPTVVLPGSHAVSSPRDMSGQHSPGGGSMSSIQYGGSTQVLPYQGGMIESPKPLSPGQPPPQDQHRLSIGDASHSSQMLRHRSPSLTTQFQQQHFGRGSGGRTPPQPPSQFPTSHHGSQPAPVLPPLGNQTQQPRGNPQPTSMQAGPGPSMLQHQQLPPSITNPGSNPGSHSSHGRSSGSSMRDAMGTDPSDMWGYIRGLEARFNRMQDEYELRISRLQEEVISLRGQVSASQSYSSDMGQQPRY